MIILKEEIELDDGHRCIHCDYGTMTYKLIKYFESYELTEHFLCLSYDEEDSIWRGEKIEDLIQSIKNDNNDDNREYHFNEIQRENFISKLELLIPTK
jgi:transcription-repair coupling factor (superfamily II helicase)